MEKEKWTSSVVKTLKSDCETVWKISSDFVGLKKYEPFVDVCDVVEGEPNSVGCVRSVKFRDNWAKEKLVAIDPLSHCYSYAIGENNMGLVGYVATLKLQAVLDGTVVEWSFEADPSSEHSREELIGMMRSLLEELIQGIEAKASSPELPHNEDEGGARD